MFFFGIWSLRLYNINHTHTHTHHVLFFVRVGTNEKHGQCFLDSRLFFTHPIFIRLLIFPSSLCVYPATQKKKDTDFFYMSNCDKKDFQNKPTWEDAICIAVYTDKGFRESRCRFATDVCNAGVASNPDVKNTQTDRWGTGVRFRLVGERETVKRRKRKGVCFVEFKLGDACRRPLVLQSFEHARGFETLSAWWSIYCLSHSGVECRLRDRCMSEAQMCGFRHHSTLLQAVVSSLCSLGFVSFSAETFSFLYCRLQEVAEQYAASIATLQRGERPTGVGDREDGLSAECLFANFAPAWLSDRSKASVYVFRPINALMLALGYDALVHPWSSDVMLEGESDSSSAEIARVGGGILWSEEWMRALFERVAAGVDKDVERGATKSSIFGTVYQDRRPIVVSNQVEAQKECDFFSAIQDRIGY